MFKYGFKWVDLGESEVEMGLALGSVSEGDDQRGADSNHSFRREGKQAIGNNIANNTGKQARQWQGSVLLSQGRERAGRVEVPRKFTPPAHYSAITVRLQCDYSAITVRLQCHYSAWGWGYSAITVLGVGVT